MSIKIVGDNLIHYEVLGHGEPMIFIHGWLGSWRYWWPTMQALSSRHRTYAYDLWGFGDSSKDPEQYSFDLYVNMLHQFIGEEGINIIKPATIVGHSLGAAVALKFALQAPEHVKRVAAISLPVYGTSINSALTNSESAAVMNRVLGVNYPEIELEIKKTDTAAVNNLAQELSTTNFIEEIEECERPLLLVFGEQDPLISQSLANLPEPNSSLAYISLNSCSHFPMLEQAVKFNRLVHDFTHADDDLQKIAPKEMWQRRNR